MDWCEGAKDPSRYFIALNVTTAKRPVGLGTPWSDGLDEINAFDAAEVNRVWMGELNRIVVSSFCSPDSLIWGHDVASAACLERERMLVVDDGQSSLPVFDGTPLIDAAAALFGDESGPKFRLAPGTLCPAASKNAEKRGPCIVYAACGIGLRMPGSRSASLLMEDAGHLPVNDPRTPEERRTLMAKALARSVLAVGRNQRVNYQAVVVAYSETTVGPDEIGCSLLLAPYFSLAINAMPEDGLRALKEMNLSTWKATLGHL
jgi:hypothetical protein